MSYKHFLRNKRQQFLISQTGFEISDSGIKSTLYPWQRLLVKWAIYKGRGALFEDCGLGKTPQQLEWARIIHEKTKENILILAPLAVSYQTKREGDKFKIPVNVCKTQDDVISGINITNYERLHHFDPSTFIGVVLDESSILKNFTGKFRNQIIETFQNTPYRLACTATPAPNDYTELGNTSEFLGVMTRSEMLSMFFINDASKTGTWRLKGHVKNNLFWKWLVSWAMIIRAPSDLGFENNGFDLPKLTIQEHIIDMPPIHSDGGFFPELNPTLTLNDRRKLRRESIQPRVVKVKEIVEQSESSWLFWGNLNQETDEVANKIDNTKQVKGSDDIEWKEKAFSDFALGKLKRLVTKPSMGGFGMNWQVCHNVVFVGLSDSYEQFYQAIRRCWRFGQTNPVTVHIVISNQESVVLSNIKKKEQHAQEMYMGSIQFSLSKEMKKQLKGFTKTMTKYHPDKEMRMPEWLKS